MVKAMNWRARKLLAVLVFFNAVFAVQVIYGDELSKYRESVKVFSSTDYFQEFLNAPSSIERESLFQELNKRRSIPKLMAGYTTKTPTGLAKRCIYVFAPESQSFPGHNNEIVVLTDEAANLVSWKDIGVNNTMFVAVEAPNNPEAPVLEIVRRQRHVFDRRLKLYYYSLKNDKIEALE